MKCQKCGTEYEGNFCPNCGASTVQQTNTQIQPTKKKKKKKGIGCLIVILCIIAFVTTIAIVFGDETSEDVTSSGINSVQSEAITEKEETESSNSTSKIQTESEAEKEEKNASKKQETAITVPKGKVNYENFEKIQNGMTYNQVVEIFGEEGKILSEAAVDLGDEYKTTIYYWYDDTGIANCNVTIQGGKVVAKAQVGLQ